MLKVSDLVQVRRRGWPLILHASLTRYSDSDAIILHISDRMGKPNNDDNYERRHITRCSRVTNHWHVFSNAHYGHDKREIRGILEGKQWGRNFVLCPKCGTLADFDLALNEYWDNRVKVQADSENQDAADTAYRQATNTMAEAVLDLFIVRLRSEPSGDNPPTFEEVSPRKWLVKQPPHGEVEIQITASFVGPSAQDIRKVKRDRNAKINVACYHWADQHIDHRTDEVNCTALAEQVAQELDHPEWLEDDQHDLWDIAVDCAADVEAGLKLEREGK